MAVLEDVPSIQVVVVVSEDEATEHDDPNAADQDQPAYPTSTKYIECVDGAEFSIKINVDNNYAWGYRDHALRATCLVDGKQIYDTLIEETRMKCVHIRGYEFYCAATNQRHLQKCKFSNISTIDDAKKDRVEHDTKLAKDLGLIEVHIRRCIVIGNIPASHKQPLKKTDKWELAEKALKGRAMSHGASFSESYEKIAPCETVRTEPVDKDDEPIATFRFHYRSRDALKREMVIPRSPSPGSRPVGQMSRAELERLAEERLNQLQEVNVKDEDKRVIKREFGEVIDLSEEPERPIKVARQGEVIDLTGDLTDDEADE